MTTEELIKLLQLCDPEAIVQDRNGDEIDRIDDSEDGFVYLEV